MTTDHADQRTSAQADAVERLPAYAIANPIGFTFHNALIVDLEHGGDCRQVAISVDGVITDVEEPYEHSHLKARAGDRYGFRAQRRDQPAWEAVQGRVGALAGVPLRANPYPAASDSHERWAFAWRDTHAARTIALRRLRPRATA